MLMDIDYGISDEIGWRPAMEDEHAIYEDNGRFFFSAEIYDGHGGRRPAQIAAEMLTPSFLHEWAIQIGKPLRERKGEADMLRDAYLAVDKYLVEKGMRAGTCAVQLYLIGERFLAANAGDSRTVIGTDEGAVMLTRDHKPDVPGERLRIEALGGNVVIFGVPRVEGVLAISRALGDSCLKPYVSAEPRITEGILGRDNDFAVLACDGVWDVLTPETVLETVRLEGSPQKAAEGVSKKALDHGSTDNITVIVLDLRRHTSSLGNRKMKILNVYDALGSM